MIDEAILEKTLAAGMEGVRYVDEWGNKNLEAAIECALREMGLTGADEAIRANQLLVVEKSTLLTEAVALIRELREFTYGDGDLPERCDALITRASA